MLDKEAAKETAGASALSKHVGKSRGADTRTSRQQTRASAREEDENAGDAHRRERHGAARSCDDAGWGGSVGTAFCNDYSTRIEESLIFLYCKAHDTHDCSSKCSAVYPYDTTPRIVSLSRVGLPCGATEATPLPAAAAQAEGWAGRPAWHCGSR